jgi:hypothetical protein
MPPLATLLTLAALLASAPPASTTEGQSAETSAPRAAETAGGQAVPVAPSAHAAGGNACNRSDRPMSTDRPDVTESPYTVPTGCWQVETSAVEYTRDRHAGTSDVAVLPTNLKLGITRALDIEVIVSPYHRITFDGVKSARSSGPGDLTLRAKFNLAGDDRGRIATALMPFVSAPLGAARISSGHVEGGLVWPTAFNDLPGGFDVGAMLETDVVYDDRDARYALDVVHSVTVDHALAGDVLHGYVEYAGAAGVRAGHRYAATLDTGLEFALAPDLQFDAGVLFGLTPATPGVGLLCGVSFRF